MGCGAFPFSFELGIALPNGAPILVVRMTDLGPPQSPQMMREAKIPLPLYFLPRDFLLANSA